MESTPDPVDWRVAERVATRVANRGGPDLGEGTRRRLEEDFAALSPVAEGLVEQSTGLKSLEGRAQAEVTDRAGWVRANLRSFRRLLRPILERASADGRLTRNLPGALGAGARAAAGAELGVVLGWMSTRVLGQYDLLFAEGPDSPGDTVYYVGPNVVSLERRHGFPPDEFRLWIAVHELTHRAQFTGVPWMRQHFLGLVDEGVSLATPNAKEIVAALKRVATDVRAGRNPLSEAGLVGVLASAEQLETLRSIQALMSLLEGHGDITMNRAARDRIPGADRFAKTLQKRRESATPIVRLFQQLIGLEAKMRQYQEGERFVEDVERAGGPSLLARVWEDPGNLPNLDEIRKPALWVARVNGRALELA
ncbi:MAG: zinc-dependent metalloprotease [Actinomycetota bacterium]|nr:zinc-dependent metalloprotease [Actinomycetota bacterium]